MQKKEVKKFIPDTSKIPQQYLSLLRQMGDTCTQRLQIFLKQFLHIEVDIIWKGIESKSFKEFMSSLPESCCIQILHIMQQKKVLNYAFLVQSIATISGMQERLLGSDNISDVSIKFTSIDKIVVSKITKAILEEFRKAFADMFPVSWEIVRHETSPTLASILSDREDVVVLNFEIAGNLPKGELYLCLPTCNVLPLMENYRSSQVSRESKNPLFQQHLKKVDLNVSVRLGEAQLTYAELVNLTPGDVVKLNIPYEYKAHLYVENECRFSGQIGKMNNRWAFLIDEPVKEK